MCPSLQEKSRIVILIGYDSVLVLLLHSLTASFEMDVKQLNLHFFCILINVDLAYVCYNISVQYRILQKRIIMYAGYCKPHQLSLFLVTKKLNIDKNWTEWQATFGIHYICLIDWESVAYWWHKPHFDGESTIFYFCSFRVISSFLEYVG